MRPRVGRRGLAGALALLTLVACKGDSAAPASAPATTAASPRPVRMGVWLNPDPAGSGYGAIAARSLLYPQLFRATPGGAWAPGLVEPRSDRTGPGAKTARFVLRRNARWSDGARITVADLRRTMDKRFVLAVDDPAPSGAIVVRFTQSLPGWRRLWSGLNVITPPREGLYGGPYALDRVTPNLETVLKPNPRYYGAAPRIAELRLVLVPDTEVAARLMEQGELDVLAPPAYPGRTGRLEEIDDARVVTGDATKGGWAAALVANPNRVPLDARRALFGLVDGPRFADVLLHNEARSTGAGLPRPDAAFRFGARPAVAGVYESPPSSLLLHAMQRTGHKQGLDFDLRQDDFDHVLAAFGASEFDALLRLQPTTPETCWVCETGTVDAALATAADAGNKAAIAALRKRLRDDALVLPLWRERPVVAVRDGLEGVRVNGFSVLGPAWDAEKWHWDG